MNNDILLFTLKAGSVKQVLMKQVAFCSQWKGEVKDGAPELTAEQRTVLEQELSDTLTFLVRLAQLCHVDLPKVVLEKFEHNAAKYPVTKVFGSSKKYTDYPKDTEETK